MPSDTYPFAVGRIRVIESSLLDRSKLARLAELPYEGALKLLCEWGYAADYPIKTDADALIAFRRTEVRGIIEDVTPDKALTDLFYLDMDATNIKLLIKSRLLGNEDFSSDELTPGLFPIETLRECVSKKDYEPLGEELAQSLKKAEDVLKRERNPRLLSAAVDNAFYSYIMSVLKTHKNEFCTRYFTAKTDFTNILSVLRARALHWDSIELAPMIVPGGTLSGETLCDALECESEKLPSLLAKGDNADAESRALSLYSGGSAEAARASLDEYLLNMAREEKFDPFGIGPIAYFLLASESECKALRVLFAKKRVGTR